jgi:hypothetical protein
MVDRLFDRLAHQKDLSFRPLRLSMYSAPDLICFRDWAEFTATTS